MKGWGLMTIPALFLIWQPGFSGQDLNVKINKIVGREAVL